MHFSVNQHASANVSKTVTEATAQKQTTTVSATTQPTLIALWGVLGTPAQATLLRLRKLVESSISLLWVAPSLLALPLFLNSVLHIRFLGHDIATRCGFHWILYHPSSRSVQLCECENHCSSIQHHSPLHCNSILQLWWPSGHLQVCWF